MIGIVKKGSNPMKKSQQEIVMVTRMMKESLGKSTVRWLYHRNWNVMVKKKVSIKMKLWFLSKHTVLQRIPSLEV